MPQPSVDRAPNHRVERQTKFWPAEREFGPRGGDLMLHMCAEDAGSALSSDLYNCSGRPRNGERGGAVRLEGCSKETAAILRRALPDAHDRDDLPTALSGFVQMMGTEAILGECAYEIVKWWDDSGSSPVLLGARLVYFPVKSLARKRGKLYQVIPAGALPDAPDGDVVPLSAESICIFAAPPRWQSRLQKMRQDLVRIGRSEQEWTERVSRAGGVDDDGRPFSEAAYQYRVAQARATSELGWTGRGLFQEYYCDYYFAERHLRWSRFCIELRDDVLARIEGIFKRIAKAVGEDVTLKVEGLSTVAEVRAAEDELRHGTKGISELLRLHT